MNMSKPFQSLRSLTHGWRYAVETLYDHEKRRFFSSHDYMEKAFRRRFGRDPDYHNPQTFSEKLCWIKIYDRNPLYRVLADKIAVRDYVRGRAGEEVLIPCYGVWDRASDVPFDDFPERFVLKCNHESGFVIICRDKSAFDFRFARRQLAVHLCMNYYYKHREWHYRDIRPRIMAEKLLTESRDEEPVDYKIHCFKGVPQFIYVIKNRHSRPRYGFYSLSWELLPFNVNNVPTASFPRPKELEKILNVAEALSQGLTYCRVDLYAVGGKVYFGEITLIPGAGMIFFTPDSYNTYWGERLILPINQ